MQYCPTQSINQLQRLFHVQTARTYEYFLIYKKQVGFGDMVYRSFKRWRDCNSCILDENWHNSVGSSVKDFLNKEIKYKRMIEAKQKFENAGGTYE